MIVSIKRHVEMVFAACWLVGSTFGSAYAFDTLAKQAYMVDLATGAVLLDKAGEERMYPASMTKIMTMYVLFKELKAGHVSLDTTFPVSEKAWRMGGSKMFVELNSQVRVEDLIRGVLIQSGNDACVVLAEGLAGTEEEFAKRMNAEAARLGMTGSQFRNATGWPDENHYMTAHDLVVLSQAMIRDFPEYYHYFSELEFTWHGIKQQNRNMLLAKGMNVDGLKTGHTDVSGYGMAVSAVDSRNAARRLIAVVHGLHNMKERAEVAEAVLQYGLHSFETNKIFSAGEVVTKIDVALGAVPQVDVSVAHDVSVTMQVAAREKTKFKVSYETPLLAPLKKGAEVGFLIINAEGMPEQKVPLIVAVDVAEASFVNKLIFKFKHVVGVK